MRRAARRAVIIAAGAALAGSTTVGMAVAAQSSGAGAVKTLSYYAFDINNNTNDPGFIAAPGTKASVFSQGDELIINDQLTVTRKKGAGYPIVGYDSGVCTLTRVPEKY